MAILRFSEKRIRESNGGDDHSLVTARAKALQKTSSDLRTICKSQCNASLCWFVPSSKRVFLANSFFANCSSLLLQSNNCESLFSTCAIHLARLCLQHSSLFRNRIPILKALSIEDEDWQELRCSAHSTDHARLGLSASHANSEMTS